jgi:hypothetical protein
MRWLVLLLGLGGCVHSGVGADQCYDGAMTSYCVVNVTKNQQIVTGSGIVGSVGTILNGVGSMMTGEGAIASGVGAIVVGTK